MEQLELCAVEAEQRINALTLTVTLLTRRVEALEEGSPSWDAELREITRTSRWHETFDAALPTVIKLVHDAHCTTRENLEAAYQYAAAHADRAHGPLEP
jgi:hypothetical protein